MPGDDTITAYADYNNDGVRDPNPAAHEPQDTALKTWNLPPSTEGAHVTGAGAIDPTPGGVGRFTFNTQKKQSEPSPTGKLDYEAPGLDVRSTSITAIVQSGNTATLFGIATINGSGSFVFRVDIVDGGEPSSSDHFRIRLSTGYDSGDKLLTRGNIQTHWESHGGTSVAGVPPLLQRILASDKSGGLLLARPSPGTTALTRIDRSRNRHPFATLACSRVPADRGAGVGGGRAERAGETA